MPFENTALWQRLPSFVRTNQDVHQYKRHFQGISRKYEERRKYIWDGFQPLLEQLKEGTEAPGDRRVTEALEVLTSTDIHSSWQTALERRVSDPAGAITAARTLLETVFKHILDASGTSYNPSADLPNLYQLTARLLNLAPNQQTEPILKQVLGGCTTVVEGVGAMRNRLGDAHGKGQGDAHPEPRHAELAVSLAGAAATFLVKTWEKQRQTSGLPPICMRRCATSLRPSRRLIPRMLGSRSTSGRS